MKLIFFGTSDFSKPVFEILKKEGVKPRGGHAPLRGYSPTFWNLDNSLQDFKNLKPDLCVVAAYGRIIPKEYLEIPKYGFLNIHPSLLPKYRGPSPIQTAILNGDKETGVTIILMDEKVDHGPILKNQKSKIKNTKYKQLERELSKLGAELLIEILPKWVAKELKPVEQNHSEATFTKKFSWPDGKIDWSKTAEEIDRQIRALNPEPGVWTKWENKFLKILEAEPIESNLTMSNEKPGQVRLIENEVIVVCGRGVLILKQVQLEGRKIVPARDFVLGHQSFAGHIL